MGRAPSVLMAVRRARLVNRAQVMVTLVAHNVILLDTYNSLVSDALSQ